MTSDEAPENQPVKRSEMRGRAPEEPFLLDPEELPDPQRGDADLRTAVAADAGVIGGDPDPVSSGALRRGGVLLSARGAQYLLAFVAGLILARTLGPAGRAAYALPLNLAVICWVVSHFSAEAAVARLLSRREATAEQLAAFSTGAMVWLGAIGMGLAVAIGLPVRDALLGGASSLSVVLAAATIPPTVGGALYAAILLRRGRLKAYAITQLALVVTQLLLLVGAATADALTPETALVINLVASWTAVVGLGVRLAKDLGTSAILPRVQLELTRRVLRLGSALQGSSIALHLNLRADLLLVGGLETADQAGVYSLSVILAELTYVATTTIGLAAIQDQADLGEREAISFTLDFARQTLALASILACVAAVATYPVITVAYGDAWRGAALPCVILCIGAVGLAVEAPIRGLLFRLGSPGNISLAALVAMIVNIALNLALIPLLGISGAAIASAVSYWVAAAAMLVLLHRTTDEPVLKRVFALPRTGDIVLIPWQRLRSFA